MLDIIIPVYNEAGNIQKTLDEIKKNIKTDKRIFIVYDFDEDNTLPIVKKIKGNYQFEIILLRNDMGRGVINAIKKGFQTVSYDKILVIMADLSDDLEVVDSMVQKMNEGYDEVCGSRYMKGGEYHGEPSFKGFLSKMAGLSLHSLTKIPTHDVTNSFKLYSKNLLNNVKIESNGGFELGLEITVKAYCYGFKIAEVPSKWYDRTDGESHFHLWKWMPGYLHWYFYCIKNTWFRDNSKSVVNQLLIEDNIQRKG